MNPIALLVALTIAAPYAEPKVADPVWAAGFCAGYNLAAQSSASNMRRLHERYDAARPTGQTRKLMQVVKKAELGAIVPELKPVKDYGSLEVEWSADVVLMDRDPPLRFRCPVAP